MRRAVAAGSVALLLLLGACGTRMSAEAIARADGSAPRTAVPVAPVTSAAVPAATPIRPIDRVGTGVAAPAAAAAVATRKVAETTAAQIPSAAPAQPAQADPNAPCTQTLQPVILGQTSPSSGIIGATDFNMRTGMALWARDVNARGGLACHPVKLYQMDDAADPARVTANLNDLVHNKKAIAIVGAGVPTTFPAARNFAERNQVPFVGGDLIEAEWFASPWFFPQGGGPLASYAGAMKEAAKSAGTKKIGLVHCVEAAICGQIHANFSAMAKASGLEVVLRKTASIVSPDYSAECQALKAAGAGAVFVALEGSGNARFARSCLALNCRPAVATSAIAVTADAVQDPNIRELGYFLGAANAPFLSVDTPGGRGFRAAYDRFAPGSSVDQNSITQFTAGRLLEAAIARVVDCARTGPITRELLLEGLWQIKNETLGGLAPPITFLRDSPPAANDCYASLTIGPDGYAAPKRSRFECFEGLPRDFEGAIRQGSPGDPGSPPTTEPGRGT